MSSKNELVEIYGAPGSPYTRKMLAVLRFRRVPYVLGWDGHRVSGTETRPAPKVPIIPIMYFTTDSEVKEVACLLYTSPSPRDLSTSRMPSSA